MSTLLEERSHVGLDVGMREDLHKLCEYFKENGLNFHQRHSPFEELSERISHVIFKTLREEGLEGIKYYDAIPHLSAIIEEDNFNLTDERMKKFRNKLESLDIPSHCVNKIEETILSDLHEDAIRLRDAYETAKSFFDLYTPNGDVNPELPRIVYKSLNDTRKDLSEGINNLIEDLRFHYTHPVYAVDNYWGNLKEIQEDMDLFKEDFINANIGTLFEEDGSIIDMDRWEDVPIKDVLEGMHQEAIDYLVTQYVIKIYRDPPVYDID